MAQRYFYNTESCTYEPYKLKGSALRRRLGAYLTLGFVLALGSYLTFLHYNKPFDLVELTKENANLRMAWTLLNYQVQENEKKLSAYATDDDQNYRVILDTAPLAQQERRASVGGSVRIDESLREFPHAYHTLEKAQHLNNQLRVQCESFDELKKLLDVKLQQWASRPAIQPLYNKQLVRLHATFGMRFNPVLQIWRPHKGLDFTAKTGTPIYATGDGVVIDAYYSDSFGKVVYINHGFEFETRYAHMQNFAVTKGDQVKRGQVIGFVGNTGTSAGEHLHYEVLYKGVQINPINFFQRDLSNSEYKKLLELAKHTNGALD